MRKGREEDDESRESELESRSNEENQEAMEERHDERIREMIYDSSEFISGAKRAPDGTVPMNILEFQYPFLIARRFGWANKWY